MQYTSLPEFRASLLEPMEKSQLFLNDKTAMEKPIFAFVQTYFIHEYHMLNEEFADFDGFKADRTRLFEEMADPQNAGRFREMYLRNVRDFDPTLRT